jgi:hypothetical protein
MRVQLPPRAPSIELLAAPHATPSILLQSAARRPLPALALPRRCPSPSSRRRRSPHITPSRSTLADAPRASWRVWFDKYPEADGRRADLHLVAAPRHPRRWIDTASRWTFDFERQGDKNPDGVRSTTRRSHTRRVTWCDDQPVRSLPRSRDVAAGRSGNTARYDDDMDAKVLWARGSSAPPRSFLERRRGNLLRTKPG